MERTSLEKPCVATVPPIFLRNDRCCLLMCADFRDPDQLLLRLNMPRLDGDLRTSSVCNGGHDLARRDGSVGDFSEH